MSFDGQIEMRDTFSEALSAIFGLPTEPPPTDGGESPPIEGDIDPQVALLIDQANEAFLAADMALREGNLVLYAEKIAEAEELVRRANELITGSGSVSGDAGSSA